MNRMSERERADEEPAVPSKPKSNPDALDGGWTDSPKPAEVAPPVEPTRLAEPTPAEPAPPIEPPRSADVAAEQAEAAPAEKAPPSLPPTEVKLFPVEPAAGWTDAKPLVGAPTWLTSLWSARPSRAWMAIGAGAIVIAFIVGVLTGRTSRHEPASTVTAAKPTEREPARTAPFAVPSNDAPAASAVSRPVSSPNAPPSASVVAPAVAPKRVVGAFNAQAAKLAIDRVVPRLKGCKQPGEPPGTATVTVTFAPTGRVSDARVTTTRYAGTRTGNCIAQRLHEARVPEFTGKPTTVKHGIAVR
jgi:hypothetical protein